MSLKLETSNVKTGPKICWDIFEKSVYCFFPVNAKYLIKNQLQPLELGVLQVRSCCRLRCVNFSLLFWGLTYGFWYKSLRDKESDKESYKESMRPFIVQKFSRRDLRLIRCVVEF